MLSIIWVLLLSSNGSAIMMTNLTVSGYVINITLPTLYASYPLVYLNGSLIPSFVSGDTLKIPILGNGELMITYVPNITVGRLMTVRLGPGDYKVVVKPGVLITELRCNVSGYGRVGDDLIMNIVGPGELSYVVVPTNAKPAGQQSLLLYLLPTGVAAVIGVAYLLRRTRGSRIELNDLELSIIRFLEDSGGSALESEIAKALGAPRTSIWRSVKRLEEWGLIRVEKSGNRNRIILKRKFRH